MNEPRNSLAGELLSITMLVCTGMLARASDCGASVVPGWSPMVTPTWLGAALLRTIMNGSSPVASIARSVGAGVVSSGASWATATETCITPMTISATAAKADTAR